MAGCHYQTPSPPSPLFSPPFLWDGPIGFTWQYQKITHRGTLLVAPGKQRGIHLVSSLASPLIQFLCVPTWYPSRSCFFHTRQTAGVASPFLPRICSCQQKLRISTEQLARLYNFNVRNQVVLFCWNKTNKVYWFPL